MARVPAPKTDVARFLAEARRTPLAQRGRRRILFALDATASREPTWDMAMNLHAELFRAAAGIGMAVQLVYYRGWREFYVSPWSESAEDLLGRMTGVACRGGLTQIQRVLEHAVAESKRERIQAAVFVGDACEEAHGGLVAAAGRLALFRVPCFVFQEGGDPDAARTFRDIARITGGAHAPFAAGSAATLRALFGAVARYAAHGRKAFGDLEHAAVRGLLAQLPP